MRTRLATVVIALSTTACAVTPTAGPITFLGEFTGELVNGAAVYRLSPAIEVVGTRRGADNDM